MTALLAASVLEKVPGADILYDVRASGRCRTPCAPGGRALVNRVGHAFFKTRMRDEAASSAARSPATTTSRPSTMPTPGTIPALLILEMLSKGEPTLSELLADLHSTYFISGEIDSTVADQQAKIEELRPPSPTPRSRSSMGALVNYAAWHFNVRPSNTEPLLRLNLGA